MFDIDIEADFFVSGDLSKKLDEVDKIIAEKSEELPYDFTIALEMLGRSLDSIEHKADYENLKDIMAEFINAIFEYHTATIH